MKADGRAQAPQMEALQREVQERRSRSSRQAQMALFKQYNVNPLAGCLPIAAADAGLDRAVPDAVERRRALPGSRSSRAGSTT
jgi:hypothetical protein